MLLPEAMLISAGYMAAGGHVEVNGPCMQLPGAVLSVVHAATEDHEVSGPDEVRG